MVSLLTVVGGVALIFTVAYLTYGRYMSRMFDLDEDRPTPAHDRYDGVDYVPSRKLELFGHHFSSVAGGAPIIGPITAALAWGWAPALAWIVVGTIVYGAMNDFAVLTMSVRHDGRSVGHIFGQYVGERGKSLMLSLAFTANLLVIGVLSLVVAIVFDAYPSTATASVCYVVLALLFGLYKRYGLPFRLGTLLFVPAVFGGVWVGLQYPLVLVSDGGATVLPTVVNANVSVWLVVILLYAFFASVLGADAVAAPRLSLVVPAVRRTWRGGPRDRRRDAVRDREPTADDEPRPVHRVYERRVRRNRPRGADAVPHDLLRRGLRAALDGLLRDDAETAEPRDRRERHRIRDDPR